MDAEAIRQYWAVLSWAGRLFLGCAAVGGLVFGFFKALKEFVAAREETKIQTPMLKSIQTSVGLIVDRMDRSEGDMRDEFDRVYRGMESIRTAVAEARTASRKDVEAVKDIVADHGRQLSELHEKHGKLDLMVRAVAHDKRASDSAVVSAIASKTPSES